MNKNDKLKDYLDREIKPVYDKNDEAHNLDHVEYVIKRSLKFANNIPSINYDMVETIAIYHDIGHHIDSKNHEKVSAEILLNDNNLKKFFTDSEIKTMSEAVYDHRASLEYEPRSIYGKIVSSADRNVLVDVVLKRTYNYRIKHMPNASLEEIIEESRKHCIDKFGKNGYAKEKIYFKDEEYENFLEEIALLTENKDMFYKRYIDVNGLGEVIKKVRSFKDARN